uniref:InfA n=1 Tax=Oryza meyeriana TaxID=83307 RepID=A0A2H4NAX9_9ORYZ|nr:infA [Oryza meyeriana]
MTEKKNGGEKKNRGKQNYFRGFSYGSPTQRNVPRSPRE